MIILTLFFFSFGVILCAIHANSTQSCGEKLSKKHMVRTFLFSNLFYEYIITILATILGVTLAIICTNYDNNENNRIKTIDFLSIVDTELLAKERLINELVLEFIEILPENETNVAISPILSLEVILTNDPYSSTLSSYTYGALLDNRTAINECQKK